MRGASVYRNQNKTKGAAAARTHDQTHREEEHPRNHLLKSRRRRNTGVWSALPWPRVALRYSRGWEHAQQVTMISIFPDKWPHTAHQAPPLLGWLLKDLGQGGTATAMPTPSRARAQERFRVPVRKPIFPAPGPEPQPCDKHTQPQKALLALRRDPLLPTPFYQNCLPDTVSARGVGPFWLGQLWRDSWALGWESAVHWFLPAPWGRGGWEWGW